MVFKVSSTWGNPRSIQRAKCPKSEASPAQEAPKKAERKAGDGLGFHPNWLWLISLEILSPLKFIAPRMRSGAPSRT